MENTHVGPFLILGKLGTTRRQKVYRARQIEQSRDVALKFITLPPKFDRSRALEKLSLEFDALRSLKHPNLARVFGAGVFEDKVFVASELVNGESLSSLVARRGRLAADSAIDIARQIASCLGFLHGHDLLHSKLTPDKILIADDGSVKVTDLRINRKRKVKPQRKDRRDMELVAYLAPEQLQGQTGPRSDLYSLGVILYEMLTGKLPYQPENLARISYNKRTDPAPSVSETVLDCPVWLDRLVSSMLDPNPRRRPHSADAVRLTLEEIQSVNLNHEAAVEKMAGTFNPLNAGADKTEALRLLRGQVPTVQIDPVIWYHRTSVLAVAMLAVIGLGLWALWPKSLDQMMDEATALMRKGTPASWRQARSVLEGVIDRAPADSEQGRLAQVIFDETKRLTLLDMARVGRTNSLQSDAVIMFVEAWQDETNCLFNEAFRRYDLITSRFRDSMADRYVVEEAEYRREGLEPLRELPYDDRELLRWINNSVGDAGLDRASRNRLQSQLEGVISRLEGSKMYSQCVKAAHVRLEKLSKLSLSSSQVPESRSESGSDGQR